MTDNRQSGLSLLEVLVSVAIFAFGLLALAALMANGMRSNTSAMHRSFATNQAYDMADRMRANPGAEYDGITGVGSDPLCISTGCSPAEMLQYDQFQWNSDNQNFLPGDESKGKVVKSGDIYTITIMWDDTRSGAEGENCNPADEDDMTCFVFEFQL